MYTPDERNSLLGDIRDLMQQLDLAVEVDLDAKLAELQDIQHDLGLIADDDASASDCDWLRAQADTLKAEIDAARSTPSVKVADLVHAFLHQWEIAKPAAGASEQLVQEVMTVASALDPEYVQLDQEYAELEQSVAKQEAKMGAAQHPGFKSRLEEKAEQLYKELAEKKVQMKRTVAGQLKDASERCEGGR